MPILPSFGLATHNKHVRIKHTFEQIGATTIVGKKHFSSTNRESRDFILVTLENLL